MDASARAWRNVAIMHTRRAWQQHAQEGSERPTLYLQRRANKTESGNGQAQSPPPGAHARSPSNFIPTHNHRDSGVVAVGQHCLSVENSE